MAIDEDDIRHLFELRDATKKRLRAYELQKTTYGISVPAHIAIEIKQAEKDLALLDAKLQTVQPSADVVQAVGPVETQTLLLDWRQKQLGERVESGFHEVIGQIRQLVEQVVRNEATADQRHATEQRIRAERQEEHDARLTAIETGVDTNAEQVALLFRRISVVRWLIITLIVAAIAVGVFVWYRGSAMIIGIIAIVVFVAVCLTGAVLLATKNRHPK